jgi:hypothetical protein
MIVVKIINKSHAPYTVAMHDKEVLCIVWKRNVLYLNLGTTWNDGE